MNKEWKNPRPLLVKSENETDRNKLWERRKELKKSTLIMKGDLPIDIERGARKLLPYMHRARGLKMKANI